MTLDTIGRMAASYRARRAMARTRAAVEALPAHLQKDIGWPNAFGGGSKRYGDMA